MTARHVSLDVRPEPQDLAPWATGYLDAAEAAMAAAPGEGILHVLEHQMEAMRALLASAPSDVASHRYAPGKWSLAESLLHVADAERVFAYRTLRIARGDSTPLPGFEQDEWVPESRASARSLSDILTELQAVRAASLALVQSLDDTAIQRTGVASGNRITVRALVWMMAGHFAHHLELTRTRYLAAA
jgi:hypothetical protein